MFNAESVFISIEREVMEKFPIDQERYDLLILLRDTWLDFQQQGPERWWFAPLHPFISGLLEDWRTLCETRLIYKGSPYVFVLRQDDYPVQVRKTCPQLFYPFLGESVGISHVDAVFFDMIAVIFEKEIFTELHNRLVPTQDRG